MISTTDFLNIFLELWIALCISRGRHISYASYKVTVFIKVAKLERNIST
jgi:hypothetical protein